MKKSWILHGLFISYPEKEETWHELKSYGTYTDALSNARRKNEHGIDENGYFAFRIIERTYSDKTVFDSQSIQLSRAEAVSLGNKIQSAFLTDVGNIMGKWVKKWVKRRETGENA